MPHRKFKLREKLDSEEVQGEGSWVIVRRPNWDAVEEVMGSKDGLSDLELGKKIMESLVDDWNWVDDDDQPLPKPSPETVRKLPIQEMLFLVNATGLGDLNQKNSVPKSGDTLPTTRRRR